MPGGTIRLLVLSDLHAFVGQTDDGSRSLMAIGPGQGGATMIDECVEILQDQGLNVDAVLVAGDISDRADDAGLSAMWALLQSAADKLGAPLLATAGNHDYDSHPGNDRLPRGSLLNLRPHFPFGTRESRLSYFTDDFAIFSNENLLVISLNTAAAHGYSVGKSPEMEHGRVRPEVIEALREELARIDTDSVWKILLMHHHPVQLPELDLDDKSYVEGKELLNKLLEDDGDWLIIHGHKHRPYLHWSPGGAAVPLVFSAGTFAANLGNDRTFSERVKHQFYVVELVGATAAQPAAPQLSGSIMAWTYAAFGWNRAILADGFPGETGFGKRPNLPQLAKQLETALHAKRQLDQADFLRIEPEWSLISYNDHLWLTRRLSRIAGSFVDTDPDGRIVTISIAA